MTLNIESRILFLPAPVECRIVNRLNRFVVQVRIGGRLYRSHTNNTGRLHQFLVEGRKGFCLIPARPGKTDYRLFAIEDEGFGAIIDTQFQMQALEKALDAGLILWLKGARIQKRNARLGNSVIDYLLERDGKGLYLEVKSAVLRENRHAMYPDCPTLRGRKHVKELTNYVRGGGEAIMLFIAALPGVSDFRPNRSADPELHELLAGARQAGVVLKSVGMVYRPEDSFIYLSTADLDVVGI